MIDSITFLKVLNFMVPSYKWGSTVSRLKSYYKETVYVKPPGSPGTHLMDLQRIKA